MAVLTGYPLGPSSIGANDQLLPTFTANAFWPGQAQAPTFTGGLKSPPTLAYPTGQSAVGYPNPVSDPATVAAQANPWSPTASPVLWAVAFLIVGILGLRHIHFREVE